MEAAGQIAQVVRLVLTGEAALVGDLVRGREGQLRIGQGHVHVRLAREGEVDAGDAEPREGGRGQEWLGAGRAARQHGMEGGGRTKAGLGPRERREPPVHEAHHPCAVLGQALPGLVRFVDEDGTESRQLVKA